MKLTAVLAFLIASVAAPATAQDLPKVSIEPGEAVTLRPLQAAPTAAERQKAEWTQMNLFAAQHFAGLTPPDAPLPEATAFHRGETPPPDPLVTGAVRLQLFTIAEQHTMLVVQNGLDRPIAYRAMMTSGGRSMPTDVCLVPSGLPSFEHWPYLIEEIDLSDFRYVEWNSGDPVTCE